MEKGALTLALLLALAAAAPAAQDKLGAGKQNLEQVRRELDEKRQELDRYKQEEERITDEISGLKKEDKNQQARQRELESQLSAARSRGAESRQKYESLEKAWKRLSGDLGGEAAFYSFERTFRFPYYGRGDLSRELFVRNALIEKHLLISRIRGESAKVNREVETLQRKNLELKAKKELVEKQRSAHKRAVRSKMQELEGAKERYARAKREVEDLQNAANGLTRLVRKLEKQQPYKKPSGGRELPIPRHSLSWPVSGKVISRFGK